MTDDRRKPWDEDLEADRRGEELEKHDKETEQRHSLEDVWHCPECGYKPNAKDAENCMNCGADFRGRPGTPPSHFEKEPRAGLRDDVEYA